MKKNWIQVVTLALLGAFLLIGTVLAQGPPKENITAGTYESADTVDGNLPILFNAETNPIGNAFLLDGSWSGTRYRDQLLEYAQGIYDELEAAFDSAAEQYENVTFDYWDPKTGQTWEETHLCASFTTELERGTAASIEDALLQAQNSTEQYDAEISRAWLAFTYDHPQYFWIRYNGNGGATWRVSGNTYVVSAYFYYVINENDYQTSDSRAQDQAKIKQKVETLCANCENLSTVGKLAYFDNWLAANNAYNRAAGDDGYEEYNPNYMEDTGDKPWSVISALLEDEHPVCEGYSKAFQLLCHEIDVPCVTISGSGHMWNAVQVDGQWYYMDCTWNDPTPDRNYSSRTYFLSGIFTDSGHGIEQEFSYPPADSAYFSNPDWSLSKETVKGYATGTNGNKYWMALYDVNGKMLKLRECDSISWGASQTRVIPPEFDDSILNAAVSGKVFQVGADWKPQTTASPF